MSGVLSRSLSGSVALVTGANGSIGRATCAALADAGARVVGTDLAAAAAGLNVDAWLQGDVTSSAAWQSMIDEVRKKFGRLDCLINSAGICSLERVEKTSIEMWRKVMSVNVESILLGMQTALPLMSQSGKDREGGSAIVNLSSTAGIRGVAFAAAYCASKGAVKLLSKSAAKEFAALKHPIRVNSVHPSAVDSAMMEENFKQFVDVGAYPSQEAIRSRATTQHPFGRMARPEDIAGGIAFLCTPAASYISGAEFVIDGTATA